jgi:N-acetyl-anhydromuramoyl-L-alanine amidase
LICNHWLRDARRVDSPNYSERPTGLDIDTLVIHNISLPPGQFGGPWIDQLFCNSLDVAAHPYFQEIAHLRVSAHLMIDRKGSVTQYVAFDKKAWHAGASCYRDRENCNEFSIGIELEGADDQYFTDPQYRELVRVTSVLMATYPAIQPSRIVGHCDIAPDRKTDPGPYFDWERYRKAIL